jgi:tetratricopeptide (TPR) repeat protein
MWSTATAAWSKTTLWLTLLLFMTGATSTALGQSAEDARLCLTPGEHLLSDASIDACTRLIDSGKLGGPVLARVHLVRSLFYGSRNDHRRSIADATKATEIDPRNPAGYSLRGSGYLETAEYDCAIDDFSKMIELMPKSVLGHTLRSTAYSKKGEHERAIADATKPIEMYPRDPSNYVNRAWAYLKAGKAAQGLIDVDHAFELRRGQVRDHDFYTRAQILGALGRL